VCIGSTPLFRRHHTLRTVNEATGGRIEAGRIADELLVRPPEIGYLTISNALQWRLQYSRVITEAGNIDGILRVK
jgi:hypothetical protein